MTNRKLIAEYLEAMATQRTLGSYPGIYDDAVDTVAEIRRLIRTTKRLP